MLNVIYYFKTYRNKTHRLHYSNLSYKSVKLLPSDLVQVAKPH